MTRHAADPDPEPEPEVPLAEWPVGTPIYDELTREMWPPPEEKT